MKKEALHRIQVGAAIALLACCLVTLMTVVIWPEVFNAFEAKSLDIRYKSRLIHLWEKRAGATIDDIIIIDIDNRSLEKLGQFNQWPRSYHARLIDYITTGGALAIGFDILFLEPERNQAEDSALVASTNNNAIVYHALAFSAAAEDAFLYAMQTPPHGFATEKFSLSLPKAASRNLIHMDRFDGKLVELYNASTGLGFANFLPDNDSVIRGMPLFMNFASRQYPAFAMAVALGALGATPDNIDIIPGREIIIRPPGAQGKAIMKIPVDRKCRMLVNYQGTFQTFRYISYYDVIMQRVPKELFNGRIVLIGTSAPGLSDIRPVPFQDAFPGVEIHANIIFNILTQQFISKQNLLFAILNTIIWAILVAITGIWFKPGKSAVITILVLSGFVSLAIFVFARFAYWLEMIRPLLAVTSSYLFVYVYRFLHEEKDKQRLKKMFQHYLNVSIVEEMTKNPELLKLGGEKRYATALFSDIENFTTLSENMPPEEMVSQLNEYLTAMTNIILGYDGYLDKYEGDAIMAIFGIPVEQPDHARRACKAALDMQKRLKQLRTQWRKQNRPEFHARIGINSGYMIAGNIGGTERFDYTVIGDSVNLASRLEGANKIYHTRILLSDETRSLVGDEFFFRELDRIRVKGKTNTVCVCELIDEKANIQSSSSREFLQAYHQGLECYRKREFRAALGHFHKALQLVPDDYPVKMFIKRCNYYRKNPVPREWDGVFNLKSK